MHWHETKMIRDFIFSLWDKIKEIELLFNKSLTEDECEL